MAAWESPDDLKSGRSYLCANGEWALVKAQNSHGGFWNGGGTLVVKDSNGDLKTFHKGHVCGSNIFISDEQEDLNSFYKELYEADFREFGID